MKTETETRNIIKNHVMQPLINTVITKSDPITTLVLSGGSIWGINIYGALYEAANQQLFDLKNINTIYATSVGTIIGCMISMKFDWDVYTDYIIKRPWQKICKINIENLFNAYNTCGIYSKKFIESIIEPFLKARDLNSEITLKEFYEFTQVEFHLFNTEMNNFVFTDVSYKTHPDWKLTDAIYASCCLPIVFSPHLKDGKCYIDGGFVCNYPLSHCIKDIGIENEHKILGIYVNIIFNDNNIVSETSLFDYLIVLFFKFFKHRLFVTTIDKKVTYDIIIKVKEITLENIYKIFNTAEERQKLLTYGRDEMRNIIRSKFLPQIC